ncbi:GNAT family N-acetyltransferase [Corynebacterium uberis]|uniref:GNAT family N-acetyltransferase n=1 Tax=Corynebacterium TaxID=1716 RepID=UPI001D0A5EB3|nr:MULTISPECIES: GNAT family N-acetyltransferase [Corynebacterium]MCZ9308641.1 GNAT family N-acetyltransferase [Corynebacterium sp. c6VSa_13]UDL74283.1 GNAT family N-acetyltransferase [Corynebacterium uberis]UDL74837.1 GNAT family N-acetyltransferase [Corynebacterium uberis]UDL77051.1 GNAT family N-acetyltransferase [Corynebacterium uberis]UDL79335.1 GNAT family N-acetyltransferase [Corynebacterium uberis]
MTVTIRRYRDADLDPAMELLAAAFESDPSFARMQRLTTTDSQKDALLDLFRAQISKQYAPAGLIDIAESDVTDGIVGVALWDPPQGGPSLRHEIASLPDLARIFGANLPRKLLRDREGASYHPRFPHWYLYVLAVSPRAQGQGVGSTLLNHGIDRAGDEAIYLEASTPRSAALYQRLGLVPLGEIPAHGPGPCERAMWKPPVLPGQD